MLLFCGCQGSGPAGGPRPRSREAAGTSEGLPGEGDVSNRAPINTSGGELKFRLARITLPVGAVSETVFIEVGIPSEPPGDEILPDTAYQISPNGFELNKDALLELGYYDEDIPKGRTEEDIILVHNIDGVWVEVPNFRLHTHNNSLDAPVRYLGLYALQVREIDPRTMNQPPVALFEYSGKPYDPIKGADADTPEEALKKQPKAPPADAGSGDAGELNPDGSPKIQDAGTGEQEGEATQVSSVPPGLIRERRFIAGPGDPEKKPAQAEAPADPRRESEQDGASNVAEGGGGGGTKDEVDATAETAGEGAKKETADKDARPEQDAAGTTIYFNASTSRDPDGRIVQYDWDFDSDGIFDFTSHVGPYAKHTFRYSGDYTVTLKVTDDGRYAQTAFGTQVVEIRNKDATPSSLSANIAAYPPFGSCPLTVHFASTITGGVPPYSYSWIFSDGSQSNLPNPFTTYPDAGTHSVDFCVTDLEGETLNGSLSVVSCEPDSLAEPLPRMTLDITPGSDRGQAPLTSQFTIESERATLPITYRVLFGDESPGEAEFVTDNPTFEHTYTNSGFYLLKVVATDADLKTASTFATIHAISPTQARDFTPSTPDAGMDPFSFGHAMHIEFDYTEASNRTVRFYPQETPDTVKNLAFNWDFGDGTFSTEDKPTHTFARDGVYEVRLSASDGIQRWRHRIWLPISDKKTAVAIQSPFYLEGPAPFRMQWDTIVTRGEEPLKYEWLFGDAKRSDPSTFYTFSLPGEYEVKLKVKDRFDQPYDSPVVKVRVREGTAQYRMPLAVVEDVAGSTRASVTDFDAAFPQPLSNTSVEGPVQLVDLSPDGQRIGMVTREGVLVKQVADGLPLISFLPAVGSIKALRVLDCDGLLCTVECADGLLSYLVRPYTDPLLVAEGMLLDASADGSVAVFKNGLGSPASGLEAKLENAFYINLDVASGWYSDPKSLPKLYEAALTADGKELFYVGTNQRITRMRLEDGKEKDLTGEGGRRYNLSVSAEGNAVAFAYKKGDEQDLMYGRMNSAGDYEMTSISDTTGLFSPIARLSGNGDMLLSYASRNRLQTLLEAARPKGSKETPAIDAEKTKGPPPGTKPPAKRERYGIIRMNLSAEPDDWDILSTNPRFIMESSASFDVAGPF
ncbi:PKD domain-containing protein [bacterium]|nr:PKD domain-containing protein [bacterium]